MHDYSPWSGIGIAERMTPELLDAVASKGTLQNDSESARLIIDEVSMPRVKCLLVDAVLREVRHSELPMGGIQVVLVGDFFNCRLCRVALLVLFLISPHGKARSLVC